MLGEIADHDVKVLELSALKGVFSDARRRPGLLRQRAACSPGERGVAVSLTTRAESPNWRNLVRVQLHARPTATTVAVAGTVTGPRSLQKIVEVDGFDVDVPVSEHLAFLRYADRPGVVGVAGKLLGDAGVNIGGMQVAATRPAARRSSRSPSTRPSRPDVLAADRRRGRRHLGPRRRHRAVSTPHARLRP